MDPQLSRGELNGGLCVTSVRKGVMVFRFLRKTGGKGLQCAPGEGSGGAPPPVTTTGVFTMGTSMVVLHRKQQKLILKRFL